MAKTTGIAQFSEGRSDMHRVSPLNLHIKPGWNMREESPELTAHIEELANSIAEIGVKEPLTVKLEKDGKLYVTNGHCRYRAAMLVIERGIELKTVPVVSEGQYVSDADMVLSQIVRNAGKPLTVIEQGKVFKKLLDLGWKQTDIAAKCGMSAGRISQILEMQTMPEPVKAAVIAGTVSASLAAATVKAEGGEAATKIIAQAATVATGEGRKVRPSDVGSSRFTVKDAFENAEIDNSDADSGYVVVKFLEDDFEKVRKMLGL